MCGIGCCHCSQNVPASLCRISASASSTCPPRERRRPSGGHTIPARVVERVTADAHHTPVIEVISGCRRCCSRCAMSPRCVSSSATSGIATAWIGRTTPRPLCSPHYDASRSFARSSCKGMRQSQPIHLQLHSTRNQHRPVWSWPARTRSKPQTDGHAGPAVQLAALPPHCQPSTDEPPRHRAEGSCHASAVLAEDQRSCAFVP